jgi:hypothetical protein
MNLKENNMNEIEDKDIQECVDYLFELFHMDDIENQNIAELIEKHKEKIPEKHILDVIKYRCKKTLKRKN